MIRGYTMVGEPRLRSLYALAKAVCGEDLPGNFVECGVAAGGSSALLAAVIGRHSRRPRRLFSFDTFQGMPESSALDRHEGEPASASGWGAGTCAAPESSLAEVCGKLGVGKWVEPVKGLLRRPCLGTGSASERSRCSTWMAIGIPPRATSSTFYLTLWRREAAFRWTTTATGKAAGGAFSEFEKERGQSFKLNRIDETGVWFVK